MTASPTAFGDRALLLEFPGTTAVLTAAAALRTAALPGVVDIVPGARTVLLVLDVGGWGRETPGARLGFGPVLSLTVWLVLAVMVACVEGRLDEIDLHWRHSVACTVVPSRHNTVPATTSSLQSNWRLMAPLAGNWMSR